MCSYCAESYVHRGIRQGIRQAIRRGIRRGIRRAIRQASIEKDAADNWKPSKKKSIERIDGIVAMIMAVDRASTQPPPEKSIYETRDMLWV
jgi:phage terminase large subunit-like protein